MKIALISYYDDRGGAGKAAFRLFRQFEKEGHEVRMFVFQKTATHPGVVEKRPFLWRWKHYFLSKIIHQVYKPREMFSYMLIGNKPLVKAVNQFSPDIIHLHWPGKYVLGPRDFSRLKAPVCWSLHDMNAFTGGCHYSGTCQGFTSGCGKCPALRSQKNSDLSALQYRIKSAAYSNRTITFAGTSQWITEQAARSEICQEHLVVNLPALADLNLFKPVTARSSSETSVRILFSAASGTKEYRKGFDLLPAALAQLDPDKITLKIVSDTLPPELAGAGFQTELLQPTDDDTILATYYQQADMVVVPSREENFSNVIIEALACGLPVVAFRTGGNADLIIHEYNGFLAEQINPESLAAGIQWVSDRLPSGQLPANARTSMETRFSPERISAQYISLFNKILRSNSRHQQS
ncbi:MAG: hypothetical protein RLZ62_2261 [Bacteroidota bacterium]|jgi:glycosyltransferase involved in cell wall biosynthesis